MNEPTVVSHVEARLGRIVGSAAGSRHAHWSVVCSDVPQRRMVHLPRAFAASRLSAVWTVGLSFLSLRSPQTGHQLRLELFTLCDRQDRGEAERVLSAIAEAIDASAIPVLRGQVIGPLPPEAGVHALYATYPTMFDDDFATCETDYGPVAVVWLFPIGPAEERFVLSEGWKAFEKRLFQRDDVDPSDWGRVSVC